MNTILLIRDQEAGDSLGGILESENFTAIRIRDVERGLDEALTRRPQLLLVDLPLEGVSSRDLFRRAASTRTPMIVLSGVDDEEEKSRLLDEGADDYLVKPFSSRELLARIRAILRRTSARTDAIIVRFGNVEVNLERRSVTRNGRPLQLRRSEYNLLIFFLQNGNRPLTRKEILESVWGYQSSNTRTVDMHVARLRSELEQNPNAPQHILSIHSVGYRFVA
jgi:DNA-binding response OmpR family regulator